MADSQKTEQPTKKRQDKAREEGQFPSSKQFVGGVQFCAFVFMLQSYGWDWMNGTLLGMRGLLKYAFNLVDDGLVGQQLFAGEATRLAYGTDEAREGRESFLEKRPPEWKGR